ncbi:putative ABC transporter extracellular-binding protein YckB precursor [Pirellulimonas nuda]|uniref:Putative ABC transporter extracellular-binding protein YckB n=1 Tax=Pirellulimonas nuda TaxID=2528009 RepID=A0A518D6H6_9BACT|nr:transporter substrate-binding domain-containing protein [Pirellulimonas nuda]QDU87051.1 putative ABC transporter extracellular-binding protein YckB precursor [Pirellulimonas nuda]
MPTYKPRPLQRKAGSACVWAWLALAAIGGACSGQAPEAGAGAAPPPLIVGTKNSPPFALKNTDGVWTGISIELWRHAADELGLEYEFQELPLDGLITGLEAGRLDAAVAAISVTADRQTRIEFCHPHYTTGLGVAVRVDARGDWVSLLERVVSTRLLVAIGVMIALVLLCGVLFWRLERDVNQGLFGGKRRQGIEMGMWWSTILLLGHKGVVPNSTAGRIVAGLAMIASLLLLSVLTGVITSVLTVQQLGAGIDNLGDLKRLRVVTVAPSTAAEFLRQRRIPFRALPDADAALAAVDAGKADAVLYDKPLLSYLVNNRFASTIHVLPMTFQAQEYAIALPPESPLRKPLNTALLRFRASDAWNEVVYRYLGE